MGNTNSITNEQKQKNVWAPKKESQERTTENEELYSAEICDWWDPFSEHYPVKSTEEKAQISQFGKTIDKKKGKVNLSVKLMDMLNDEMIAKLQGIALA